MFLLLFSCSLYLAFVDLLIILILTIAVVQPPPNKYSFKQIRMKREKKKEEEGGRVGMGELDGGGGDKGDGRRK